MPDPSARPGPIPVGVCITSMDADPAWWLGAARRLAGAGYDAIWCWDHFMGRFGARVPVVEGWTALAMTAAHAPGVEVGPFVLNVMNRHPAVVAGMAATLQRASGGRLVLGLGIGGGPDEHAAIGIPLPPAPERVARLREAVAVIRALWTGEAVTRDSPFYPLRDAAGMRLDVPPPIVLGGETRTGARLAGEIGDGWTAFAHNFRANLPAWEDALAAAGRDRARQRALVAYPGGPFLSPEDGDPLAPWCADPAGLRASWADAGADGIVLTATGERDVARLLDAAARA